MFSLNEYDYDLPRDLIAQSPLPRRDRSRLLYMDRETGRVSHHIFSDLCDFLRGDDVLVVNNTEVVPGRLIGRKATGGRAEVLILDYSNSTGPAGTQDTFHSDVLIKSSKRARPGTEILFGNEITGEVTGYRDGIHRMEFRFSGDFQTLLYQVGKVPLPPYIRRPDEGAPHDDRLSYQTVYASEKGAVAAPTAGLHFTRDLMAKIRAKGAKIVAITLHVGYGTFLPVRVRDIREHKMHSEAYHVPGEAAEIINRSRESGGRILAVGTTSVRTLEYASDSDGSIRPGTGLCDLFIYPGYRFKVIGAMVTNFHLPQSTLLMLVSAFAGRCNVLNAYREAIEENYRFYSYGDATLIA